MLNKSGAFRVRCAVAPHASGDSIIQLHEFRKGGGIGYPEAQVRAVVFKCVRAQQFRLRVESSTICAVHNYSATIGCVAQTGEIIEQSDTAIQFSPFAKACRAQISV